MAVTMIMIFTMMATIIMRTVISLVITITKNITSANIFRCFRIFEKLDAQNDCF